MKRLFPIMLMVILIFSFSPGFGQQSDSTRIEPVDARKLSEQDHDAFVQYLEKAGKSPVDYLIQNSPFAFLLDERVFYFQHPAFNNFADLTQGYIFIKPLAELRKVTWTPNFINEENLEQAKAVALKAK